MTHVNDDTLVLLALGESIDPASAAHIRDCAQCRQEVDSYSSVVAAGREAPPLEAPPTSVWDVIAAEISDDSAEHHASGTVVPLRRRRLLTVLVAAAAGVAIGVGGVIVGQSVLDQEPLAGPPPSPSPPDTTAPDTTTLASADLQPLPGWNESGAAQVALVDGHQVLRVDVTGAPEDGYREVWLLDETAERLVSLGPLTAEVEDFVLPAGLDLDEFLIVDVSQEHYDGDPTHSGDSIVRGQLS